MLNSAKQVLAEYKIMRWQEGANFEVQLDNNIAAIDTAREARSHSTRVSLLRRCNQEPGHSGKCYWILCYKEQARSYQECKDRTKTLSGRLSNKPTLDLIVDVTKEMEALEQEYGDNQALEHLRARLEDMKPNVGELLRWRSIR